MNGIPSASLMGFIRGGRLYIPRLAINSDFSFYSPGMVLIRELVDYTVRSPELSTIDLSRGDEKYKYAVGGEEYCTVEFVVDY